MRLKLHLINANAPGLDLGGLGLCRLGSVGLRPGELDGTDVVHSLNEIFFDAMTEDL